MCLASASRWAPPPWRHHSISKSLTAPYSSKRPSLGTCANVPRRPELFSFGLSLHNSQSSRLCDANSSSATRTPGPWPTPGEGGAHVALLSRAVGIELWPTPARDQAHRRGVCHLDGRAGQGLDQALLPVSCRRRSSAANGSMHSSRTSSCTRSCSPTESTTPAAPFWTTSARRWPKRLTSMSELCADPWPK